MIIEAMFRRVTSRLILRPLARSDAEAVRQLYSDWEVAKWLSRVPWPFTSASAENFIADAEVDMEHGSGCHLAIERRVSATFVGTVSLRLPALEPDPWTSDRQLAILGYAVQRDQQRNGFASEAAASVVQLAFDQMDIARLRATVLRDNVASRRVLARLGFTIEYAGVRETPRYGGPPRVGDTFMLERSEWRGAVVIRAAKSHTP